MQYYRALYDVDQDVEFNLHNTYGIQVPEGIRQEQKSATFYHKHSRSCLCK